MRARPRRQGALSHLSHLSHLSRLSHLHRHLRIQDYKWRDLGNVDDLYYQALFRDLTVRSLRDLRGAHLPALRRVRDEVVGGLAAKHGAPAPQLLAYMHYHPQFWYFHIHIVNSAHHMFHGDGSQNLLLTAMDRFHKLDDVIRLLELDGAFYETAVLPVLLKPEQATWYEAERDASFAIEEEEELADRLRSALESWRDNKHEDIWEDYRFCLETNDVAGFLTAHPYLNDESGSRFRFYGPYDCGGDTDWGVTHHPFY